MPKIEPQNGMKWNDEDRLSVAQILLKIGYAVQIKKSGEKSAAYSIEYVSPKEDADGLPTVQ